MSPVLHTEHLPRVPGCESGKRPKTYPGVRVCVAPGCGTFLNIYNPGPWCDPCLSKDAKIRQEEKMGKESKRDAVLAVFASTPARCFNASDVQRACGAAPSCVYKNLKALVASGDLVKRAPGVYRWPTIEDAKTAPAPLPAPAPSTSGERPADVEAAPIDLPPQVGPPPFAGIDYELVVIGEVVRRIESLTGHETRIRVAAYVASRFL